MSPHSFVQAEYDAHGDIVLRCHTRFTEPMDTVSALPSEEKPSPSPATKPVLWSVTDAPSTPRLRSFLQRLRHRYSLLLRWGMHETRIQYLSAQRSVTQELHALALDAKQAPHALSHAQSFFCHHALTPLPVPQTLKRALHPRTSIGRFLLDSVRFGCTFACIFSLLFAALNYHSFWQIAKAQFALGDTIQHEQALTQVAQGTFGVSKDGEQSSSLTDSSLGLLAALPAVGPAEDRLIIPKIGKNVAIVRPSMDALINEDWKKFEQDIQDALRDGVVHYPGSARPGQAGNFFVTGHSSYYPWDPGKYKDVFARLHELEIGDRYSVYYGGEKHVYRIISKREVRPTDVSVLDQPMDKRLSTLMTCTPIGTTLRRLILTAEEIDPNTEEVLKVGEQTTDATLQRLKNLEALPM
jgi:LPXTG-site transpeptidase (sortase) family protein